MCHDKFIFDVYRNTKKKKDLEEKQKAKSGFLVKKSYDKFDPNSFCYGSNTIINGEYYMKKNNLLLKHELLVAYICLYLFYVLLFFL